MYKVYIRLNNMHLVIQKKLKKIKNCQNLAKAPKKSNLFSIKNVLSFYSSDNSFHFFLVKPRHFEIKFDKKQPWQLKIRITCKNVKCNKMP